MFPSVNLRIAEQQTQNNGAVPIASSCCNRRCTRSQLGFEYVDYFGLRTAVG
jgi:hypothetical protein